MSIYLINRHLLQLPGDHPCLHPVNGVSAAINLRAEIAGLVSTLAGCLWGGGIGLADMGRISARDRRVVFRSPGYYPPDIEIFPAL